VISSRTCVLAVAAGAGWLALMSPSAQAQWWRSGPKDFEECADLAEKAKTKEEKTSALAECNAKFAGRRKPGGGYTYFDFLQDRSFDIAGPNPTREEQKKIDEQYAIYLEKQSRENVAMAHAARQQEQQIERQRQDAQGPVHQVSLMSESDRVPVPVANPLKLRNPATEGRPRPRATCVKDSFSCEWPRLSESWNELKKIFIPPPPPPPPPPPKPKRRS
jgi:hypothetical protein